MSEGDLKSSKYSGFILLHLYMYASDTTTPLKDGLPQQSLTFTMKLNAASHTIKPHMNVVQILKY